MDRAPLANEIRGRSLRVVVGDTGSSPVVRFPLLPCGCSGHGKVRQQEGQKQYAAIRRILSLHRPAFAAGRAANDRGPGRAGDAVSPAGRKERHPLVRDEPVELRCQSDDSRRPPFSSGGRPAATASTCWCPGSTFTAGLNPAHKPGTLDCQAGIIVTPCPKLTQQRIRGGHEQEDQDPAPGTAGTRRTEPCRGRLQGRVQRAPDAPLRGWHPRALPALCEAP